MSEDRIGQADAADIFAMIAGEKGLDEKQKRTIAVWLSLPAGAKYKDVARQAGISPHTFLQWRLRPSFMAVYNRALDALFVPVLQDADETLRKAVKKDWRAALGVKKLHAMRQPKDIRLGRIPAEHGTPDDRLDKLRDAEQAEAESKGPGQE